MDAAGNAYVAGNTPSADFPVTPGAFQTILRGLNDAFVTKLNPTGSALVYSTYLGGSDIENRFGGGGIAVDAASNVYVTGYTLSLDFPTVNPVQPSFHGGTSFGDAFVAKIEPVGEISVSPASFDFSSVVVGFSSPPQSFTITNMGERALDLGIITLTGADAGEFSLQNDTCSELTIAPSATCTIEAIFAPTSPGQKSARLTIPSNDPDTPLLDVALSGEGIRGPFTLTVTKAGMGSGTVTSSPPGIACGVDCSEVYTDGTGVTLTPTPADNSVFAEWSGDPDCTDGRVTMDVDKSCIATFTLRTEPRLLLSLNSTSFHLAGDVLVLTATVTPGTPPMAVDAYVAVQLPDGTLLFLQGNGHFTLDIRPIVTGWTTAPFTGDVFHYTFDGGAPRGSYTWHGAFTAPGTLNLIGEVVKAPFTVSP